MSMSVIIEILKNVYYNSKYALFDDVILYII